MAIVKLNTIGTNIGIDDTKQSEIGKESSKVSIKNLPIRNITPNNASDNYGVGYIPSPGSDLNTYKAEQQSDWNKVFNSLTRGIAKAGISVVEPIGYILDLQQYLTDVNEVEDTYGNAFNTMLYDMGVSLDKELPIYTKSDTPTIFSPDWFYKNGDQIIKSIGYLVPGMAMTKGASLALKGLNTALSFGKSEGLISTAINALGHTAKVKDLYGKFETGASVLTSAIGQNYSEHMLSAFQQFETSKAAYYKQNIDRGMGEDLAMSDAKIRASKDASKIVELGKMNIVLNAIEYGNLFKTINATRRFSAVMSKQFGKDMLETSIAEGLEEANTDFFEQEAYRDMLINLGELNPKDDDRNIFERYTDRLGTYESLTQSAAGALGGGAMQIASTFMGRDNRKVGLQQIKDNASFYNDKLKYDGANKQLFYMNLIDNARRGTYEDVYKNLDGIIETTSEKAKELQYGDDYVATANEYKEDAKAVEEFYNETLLKYQNEPIVSDAIISNKINEREHNTKATIASKKIEDINKLYTNEDKANPLFPIKQRILDREALLYEIDEVNELFGELKDSNRTLTTNESKEELDLRLESLNKTLSSISEEVETKMNKFIESKSEKNKDGKLIPNNKAILELDNYLYTDVKDKDGKEQLQLNLTNVDKKLLNAKVEYALHSSLAKNSSTFINKITSNPAILAEYKDKKDKETTEIVDAKINELKEKIKVSKLEELLDIENGVPKNSRVGKGIESFIKERKQQLKDEKEELEGKKSVKETLREVAKSGLKETKKVIDKIEDKLGIENKGNETVEKPISKPNNPVNYTGDTLNKNNAKDLISKKLDAVINDYNEKVKLIPEDSNKPIIKSKLKSQLDNIVKEANDLLGNLTSSVTFFDSNKSEIEKFLSNDIQDIKIESNKEVIIESNKEESTDLEPNYNFISDNINVTIKTVDNVVKESVVDFDMNHYEEKYNGRYISVDDKIVDAAESGAYLSKAYLRRQTIDKNGNTIISTVTSTNKRQDGINKLIETGLIKASSKIKYILDTEYKIEENGVIVDSYDIRKKKYGNDFKYNAPISIQIELDGNWQHLMYVRDLEWVAAKYPDGRPMNVAPIRPYTKEDNYELQVEKIKQIREEIYSQLEVGNEVYGTLTDKAGNRLSKNIKTDKVTGDIILDPKTNKPVLEVLQVNELLPGIKTIAIHNGESILLGKNNTFNTTNLNRIKNKKKLAGTIWTVVKDINNDDFAIPLVSPELIKSNIKFKNSNYPLIDSLLKYIELIITDSPDITKLNDKIKSEFIAKDIDSLYNYLSNYIYIKYANSDFAIDNSDRWDIRRTNDTIELFERKSQILYSLSFNNDLPIIKKKVGANEITYSKGKGVIELLNAFENTFNSTIFNVDLNRINGIVPFSEYLLFDNDGTLDIGQVEYDNYNEFVKSKLLTHFDGREFIQTNNGKQYIYFDHPNLYFDYNLPEATIKEDNETSKSEISKEVNQLKLDLTGDANPNVIIENNKYADGNVRIKDGVDYVFESNPELANIGSKLEYSNYLNTIFPDSKVKNIIYRGGYKTEKEKVRKYMYFTERLAMAKNFVKQDVMLRPFEKDNRELLYAKINTLNPKQDIEYLANKRFNKAKEEGNDSLLNIIKGEINEIVNFEPEQIHILGSKQDIQGFKDYINNKDNNPNQLESSKDREYTPENITSLKPNEIFVFGSNAEGAHGKGAALIAKQKFGAIQGRAKGLQGQSYAIITKKDWRVEKSSTLGEIHYDIINMLNYAKEHSNLKFYVTKLGSSLAGYKVEEIKELFEQSKEAIPDNVILPKEYEVRDNIQSVIKKIPTKIISGGQTGGDLGGLKGAKELGIETGGTAPPNYISGNKSEKQLLTSFGLTEGEADPTTYVKRTMKNVDDSDGTVAILWGSSVGTGKTIGYAQTGSWKYGDNKSKDNGYKPILVISTHNIDIAAKELLDFTKRNNINILNVAGHREISQPGIEEFTKQLIIKAFNGSTTTEFKSQQLKLNLENSINTNSIKPVFDFIIEAIPFSEQVNVIRSILYSVNTEVNNYLKPDKDGIVKSLETLKVGDVLNDINSKYKTIRDNLVNIKNEYKVYDKIPKGDILDFLNAFDIYNTNRLNAVISNYNLILSNENWNKLVKHTIVNLNALGFKIDTDSYSVESVMLEDESYERIKFNDKARFEKDIKDKASARFKLFLSSLVEKEKINGKWFNKTNILGLPNRVNVDKVFMDLIDTLANTNISIDEMLGILRLKGDINPIFTTIADSLKDEETNGIIGKYSGLRSEFVNIMANARYPQHSISIVNKKYKGVNYLFTKVLRNNDNNATLGVLNEWQENLKTMPIIIRNANSLEIDVDKITNIKDHYKLEYEKHRDSLSREEITPDFYNLLRNTLEELGLKFDDRTFDYLISNSKDATSDFRNTLSGRFELVKNVNKVSIENTNNFLGSIFESFYNDDYDNDFEYTNPFVNPNSQYYLNKLASIELNYIDNNYSLSTMNSEGNIVNEIGEYTQLTNTFRQLKKDNSLALEIQKRSFGSKSLILEQLLSENGNNYRTQFNFGVFDATNLNRYSNGEERNTMFAKMQDVSALALFQNGGSSTAWYFGITNGDNGLSDILSYKRFDIGVNVNEKRVLGIDNNTLALLSKQALNEVYRITNFQNNIKNTPNKEYNVGANYFFLFPYFNKDNMKSMIGKNIAGYLFTEEEYKSIWKGNKLIITDGDVSALNIIRRFINHYETENINGLVSEFVKNNVLGYDYENEEYYHLHLDYKYGKNIPNIYETSNEKILYSVADFYLNNFIIKAEQYFIFKGDIATYSVLNNNGSINVEATLSNATKRLKAQMTPIQIGNYLKKTYNTYSTKDRKVVSNLADDYLSKLGINDYFKDINTSDGMVLITTEEAINLLYAYNRISKTMYDRILNKILDSEDSDYNYVLSGSEESVIFNGLKFIHSNLIYETKYDVAFPYFEKSGYLAITPNLTKTLQIDRLRLSMEKQGIDHLVFKSAIKSGDYTENEDTIFEKNGNLKKEIVFNPKYIRTLNRDNFGEVVKMPAGKNDTAISTQANLLAFNNIRDIKTFKYKGKTLDGYTLEKEKEIIKNKLVDIGVTNLFNRIGAIKTSTGYEYNKSKLRDLIIKEAEQRNWKATDIQQLELDITGLDFKFPLIINNSFGLIQALLFSIANDEIVKYRFFGKGYIQSGNIGYKTLVWNDLSESEKKDLLEVKNDKVNQFTVFTDNFDDKLGLQHYRINEDIVKPTQVLVAWNFRDNNGNLLNIQDYINPETNRIDFNKLPQEVLQGIGFRIPNQGHSSTVLFEIVGFLPSFHADTIIVADEIVAQMGSDFDIDKLYSYLTNYYHDYDNSIKVLNRESNLYSDNKENQINSIESKIEDNKKLIDGYDRQKDLLKELNDELYNLKEANKLISTKESETKAKELKSKITDLEEKIDSNGEAIRLIISENIKLYNDLSIINKLFTEDRLLKADYLDIFKSIYGNKEVLPHILKQLETAETKEIVNSIRKKRNSNKLIQPLNYITDRNNYINQQSGKNLVGITALYNIVNPVLQRYPAIKLLNPDKEYKGIYVKDNDGKILHLTHIGGNAVSKTNDKINYKSDNINEYITIAVDNSKLGYAGDLNLNTLNAPTVLFTRLLQTKDNKTFDNGFIDYLIGQNSVLDYINSLSNILSSEEYMDIISAKELAYVRTIEKYKQLNKVTNEDNIFSKTDLYDRLETNNDQIALLNLYKQFELYSDKFAPILTTALFSIRNGVGSNFGDIKEILSKFNYIFDPKTPKYFSNIYEIFGSYSKGKPFQYNTEIGHIFKNSILLGNDLFGDLFTLNTPLFNDLFKLYEDNTTKENITGNDFRLLLNEYIKAILSGIPQTFDSSDLQLERSNLLFDYESNKSLATRILNYRSIHKDNKLLNTLVIELGNGKLKPSIIKFFNTKFKNINDIDYIQALDELLNSKDIVARKLGQDLVKYTYLFGGVFNSISFTRYVNANYLESINVDKLFKEIDYSNGRTNSPLYIDSSVMYKQFIQHYPQKGFVVNILNNDDISINLLADVSKTNRKGEIKNHVEALVLIVKVDTEIDYPTIITYKNNIPIVNREFPDYKWWIFEHKGYDKNGNKIYVRINNLGLPFNKNLSEYDLSKFNNESLFDDNNVKLDELKEYFKNNKLLVRKINYDKIISNELSSNTKHSILASSYFGLNDGKFSLIDSLKAVKLTSYNYELAKIISAKLQEQNNKDKVIFTEFTTDTRGRFSNGLVSINNKIFNTDASFYDMEDSLNHEAIHSATSRSIEDFINGKPLDVIEQKLIENVSNVYNFALRKFYAINPRAEAIMKSINSKILDSTSSDYGSGLSPEEYKYYPLINLKEFVTGVYGNTQFVKFLNDNTYDGKTSILTKIINLFKTLIKHYANKFGITIKKGSLLEASLDTTLNLLSIRENKTEGYEEIESKLNPKIQKVTRKPRVKKDINPNIDRDVTIPTNEIELNKAIAEDEKFYKDLYKERVKYPVRKEDIKLDKVTKEFVFSVLEESGLVTKFNNRYFTNDFNKLYNYNFKFSNGLPFNGEILNYNSDNGEITINNDELERLNEVRNNYSNNAMFNPNEEYFDDVEHEYIPDYDESELYPDANIPFDDGTEVKRYSAEVFKIIKHINDRINRLNKYLTKEVREYTPNENRVELLDKYVKALINTKYEILSKNDDDLGAINNISKVAHRQLDHVLKLLDTGNIDNYKTDWTLLSTLKGLVDMWTWDNVEEYLTENQIAAKSKQYEIYSEIANKARDVNTRLSEIILLYLTDEFNEKLGKAQGKTITPKDIAEFTDISGTVKNFLDLSKTSAPILRLINHKLQYAKNNQIGLFKSYSDRIDEIFKSFEDDKTAVNKMGKHYNLFHRKDDNGKIIPYLITRNTMKYDNDIDELNKASKNLERYFSIGDIDYNTYLERKTALLKKELNINIIIDLAALGIIRDSNNKYIKRNIPNYQFENEAEYKQWLYTQLGQSLADEAIADAKYKYELYIQDLDAKKEELDSNTNLTVEEKTTELKDWKLRNNPETELNLIYSEPGVYYLDVYKIGKNSRLSRYARKTLNNEDTKYYDKEFDTIQNDATLKKLYDEYRLVLADLLRMLPDSVTDTLHESFVPKVLQDYMSVVSELGVKEASKYLSETLINGVTAFGSAELRPSPDKIHEERNSVTGKPIPSTKISYIQNISNPVFYSKDLKHNLIEFANMAINYTFMNELAGFRDISLDVIRTSKNVMLDANGNKIPTINNREFVSVKGENKNAYELAENSFNALISANKRDETIMSKNKLYSLNPIKDRKLSLQARRIENEAAELDKKYVGDYKNDKYISEMNRLSAAYKDLTGRNISITKLSDKLIWYTQLVGLGLNVTAGVNNLMFGLLTNIVHSNGRQEFDTNHALTAFKIVLNALKVKNPSKAYHLIKNFNILFDIIDTRSAEYGGGENKYRFIKNFNPYVFQTKTEYLAQGMSFIATMLKEEITTKDGKKISLYDAFDNKGNFKSELFTEEVAKQWDNKLRFDEVNEWTKFREKTMQLNKLLHGNYDPASFMSIKRGILGRFLMQFRSWLPEGVANRFQDMRYDDRLGRYIKGRWLTYGELGPWDSIRTLYKQLIYAKDAFELHGRQLDPVDIENMRRNLAEIGMYAGLFTAMVGIKMVANALGDEDDEESYYLMPILLLYNSLFRSKQDIEFYARPDVFYNVLRDPIPASRTIISTWRAFQGTYRYLTDEDYKGEPPYAKFARIVPYGSQIGKTYYLGNHFMMNK